MNCLRPSLRGRLFACRVVARFVVRFVARFVSRTVPLHSAPLPYRKRGVFCTAGVFGGISYRKGCVFCTGRLRGGLPYSRRLFFVRNVAVEVIRVMAVMRSMGKVNRFRIG